MRNSGQSDSDLFADYIHAKIVIVLVIDKESFKLQWEGCTVGLI